MALGTEEKSVQKWLTSTMEDPAGLERILQGDDAPAFAEGEQACDWVYESLGEVFHRDQARERLITHLVALLKNRPDLAYCGLQPNPYWRVGELLFNLFSLCGYLQEPVELAEPLQQILREGRVDGTWNGFDLRKELQRAVVQNQKGPELKAELFAALAGRTGIFKMTLREAVAAIAWLPASEATVGEPWVEAIQEALSLAIPRLEAEYPEIQRRRLRFGALLDEVKAPHLDWGEADWDLAEGAMRNGWPEWAVSQLEPIVKRRRSDNNEEVLVPKRVVEALIDFLKDGAIAEQPKGSFYCRLVVPRSRTSDLSKVLAPFEELRRENPFAGAGAEVGALLYAINSARIRSHHGSASSMTMTNGRRQRKRSQR
jgi:hypothetical protein